MFNIYYLKNQNNWYGYPDTVIKISIFKRLTKIVFLDVFLSVHFYLLRKQK